MDYEKYFKNKKITVMGLGLLGRGVGVIKFLVECGADLIVTDLKSAEELAPTLKELENFSGITYRLGEHNLEDFGNRDLIIRAPNAPLDSQYLVEARKKGIKITQPAALLVELLGDSITTIGITGTRGKSTVTQMIYEILVASGKTVHLAGNVRGAVTLSLLKEIKQGDFVVLELDSWQLQSFGENQVSPNVAVFSNLLNDHMNYYKGDRGAYLADKANIFLNQKPDDTIVLGQMIVDEIKQVYGNEIKSKIVVAENFTGELKVPGDHNRYNAGLAVSATRALGVSDEVIEKALADFRGVPGRLEFLGEKEAIEYWNDNNATTPDATIAALKSFPEKKGKIILIGGGADKELDFAEYGKVAPEYVKEFILFVGVGTNKIKAALPPGSKITEVDSMAKAVAAARAVATAGDLILLSPGAASFGVFKNEYDRNDQFVSIFNNL